MADSLAATVKHAAADAAASLRTLKVGVLGATGELSAFRLDLALNAEQGPSGSVSSSS
jgi:hypothetical protein